MLATSNRKTLLAMRNAKTNAERRVFEYVEGSLAAHEMRPIAVAALQEDHICKCI
jgi:hypothetical protein